MVSLYSFACGLLFAVGLCVSEMTRPSKIIGFLDVSGAWDPSLALVMLPAILIYALAWRWARRSGQPWLGGSFPGPASRQLDARLLGGAALFGVGWGLSGFCPGPALINLVSGTRAALVFVGAMALGMYGYQLLDRRFGHLDEAASPEIPGATP